ncbi:MAG: hypothetical protein GY915_03255 [bacterium]|nr:hypothetical protein [bacterium]
MIRKLNLLLVATVIIASGCAYAKRIKFKKTNDPYVTKFKIKNETRKPLTIKIIENSKYEAAVSVAVLGVDSGVLNDSSQKIEPNTTKTIKIKYRQSWPGGKPGTTVYTELGNLRVIGTIGLKKPGQCADIPNGRSDKLLTFEEQTIKGVLVGTKCVKNN